jgi:hypothetical protein
MPRTRSQAGSRGGLRRHLSYANVMSTLAVFLVLAGGTALAAGLRKNSVNSKTVKNNSLQSVDLKDGGVSGADVADGSLGATDVAPGSLGGATVADGSLKGADIAKGSLAGADFGKGTVGLAGIAAKAINSASIVDGSLQSSDIGVHTVIGRNVDESTLERVPETLKLGGHPPSAYIHNLLLDFPTTLQRGVDLGDGTFRITQACPAGDVLLSGGPIEVDGGSTVVDNFPKDGIWTTRINPHGAVDEFRVRVVCARQIG